MIRIHTRTPNRIDLAGGTLDIYPLYLFLSGGYTLNAAIDLYSEIQLETREDDQFVFRSEDLNTDLSLSRDALMQGQGDDSALRLLMEGVRFYRPATGLNITSRNQAPKGSGLGASSALLIALSGALNQLNRQYLPGEQLIQHAADLEAWALDIPTGKQDYYAAMYGGVQALHFSNRGVQRENLQLSEAFFQQLNAGLVLSFTGQSHFSGTNNWNMMKRYIDNSDNTRTALQGIRKTAVDVRRALQNEDLEALSAALNQEWRNRKNLAEGVSTPQIESMIKAVNAAGAWASKICGAGGGGCLLTFCPPAQRSAVEAALQETGAAVMQHSIVRHGLQIQEHFN